jgi:hypothetical protein
VVCSKLNASNTLALIILIMENQLMLINEDLRSSSMTDFVQIWRLVGIIQSLILVIFCTKHSSSYNIFFADLHSKS